MLFNSLEFLIFFPVVVLVYFVLPQRWRWLWLLGASYYFYMSWNPQYALLIAASTVATWLSALVMERLGGAGKKRDWALWSCIVFNLAILFFFKYYAFAAGNIEALGRLVGLELHVPAFDVLLPVGISFYTFQALGYVIDVYRGELAAERNLLRYALFISFFPQLVAGPIERSKNLMHQIHEPHYFDPKRARDGLLLMGWGFFEKLVLADRIALLVTEVYDHYAAHTGVEIVLATVLFAFQIYCDFAGYSDIAIGAARVMGFTLMKNFKHPYSAVTVSEFWRRWHISLTTWFRDYVYIPLGGSRCSKWKHYRNILITFSVSGLWHGARWSYVVWGALNGLYQVIGSLTAPFRTRAEARLKLDPDGPLRRWGKRLATFVLVDFAWLFFRANSFLSGVGMLRQTAANPGLAALKNPLAMITVENLGMGRKDFAVMLLGLVILAAVDTLRQRVDLKAALDRRNIAVRYAVYYVMIFTVLIFGIYGPEYNAASFIYFQF